MILTQCLQLILCSCGDMGSGNLFSEGSGASTAAWRQLLWLGGSHHREDGGALNKLSQHFTLQHMPPATLPAPQQTIHETNYKAGGTLAGSAWEASYAPGSATAAFL